MGFGRAWGLLGKVEDPATFVRICCSGLAWGFAFAFSGFGLTRSVILMSGHAHSGLDSYVRIGPVKQLNIKNLLFLYSCPNQPNRLVPPLCFLPEQCRPVFSFNTLCFHSALYTGSYTRVDTDFRQSRCCPGVTGDHRLSTILWSTGMVWPCQDSCFRV